MSNYDYIIIGAGASGLLLAHSLGNDAYFQDKKILLLDKANKEINDRTWCFWESETGAFDAIVHKKWPKIHFAGKQLNITPDIGPYQYKMIQGIDFYKYYLDLLSTMENVEFLQDSINEVTTTSNGLIQVEGNTAAYIGKQVFDSRFDYKKVLEQSKYPVLQQHFLGWFVKTDRAVFQAESATFMDFSIPQKGNTRFMYILPFSETEALVEYTLFSAKALEKSEYEAALKEYLTEKLDVANYEITDVEQGNIPMTCFDFAGENTDNYLKIGIAGGWAKASTGYTFYSSTKKVKQLVAHIKNGKSLRSFNKKGRFWFYDLLLLDILHTSNHLGGQIFEQLFKNRKPQLIFKFLDEDTSLAEDIYIMAAPKPWPFIKALLGRLF